MSEMLIIFVFKAIFYVFFGCTMEVTFSVFGIERVMQAEVPKRVPPKYKEGFISLYMFPLYALMLPLGFESSYALISEWHWVFRFMFWAISITAFEAIYGWFELKVLGFYTWDYYKLSRFKVFKEGLTLWTLIPCWGIAGMLLEQYAQLLSKFAPIVVSHFS
ncbi:MAG: hypothetical protein EP319_08560 [Deltaproteobacteria bacterium]|nr:MAG: hypothetical protein EP319_08560 [Deltaproteobacteria bacterium]